MNKNKVFNTIFAVEVSLLVLDMLGILLTAVLHSGGSVIFILAFIVLAILIFITNGIMVTATLKYKCPECGSMNRLSFGKYFITKKSGYSRKIKCSNCKKKNYMESYERTN